MKFATPGAKLRRLAVALLAVLSLAAVSPESSAQTPSRAASKSARLAPAPAPKVGPWQLVADEDGILVERRTVAGSKLTEFRGNGVVDAPMARVLAVMQDSPRRVDWMVRCASSWTVEEPDFRTQVSYNRTRAPWPVSDRDVILRVDTQVDVPARRVVLTFHSVEKPDLRPFPGTVRMPFLRGHWILTPENEGKSTRVEYQVHADAGGSLPDWIANIVSKAVPLKTIQGLRQQVVRMSYPELEEKINREPDYQAVLAPPPPGPITLRSPSPSDDTHARRLRGDLIPPPSE